MRYVILKKINNTWYATRNRYTERELEIIVDKHYNDVVDFESINDGECQGLEDGVIIIKDDGRELNANGVYLNDDLKPEEKKSSHLWVWVLLFFMWLFFGVYGVIGFGAICCLICLVKYFDGDDKTPQQYQDEQKEMQENLPEGHKAQGMM